MQPEEDVEAVGPLFEVVYDTLLREVRLLDFVFWNALAEACISCDAHGFNIVELRWLVANHATMKPSFVIHTLLVTVQIVFLLRVTDLFRHRSTACCSGIPSAKRHAASGGP